MPLITTQEIIPGIRIALWEPTESSDELLSILNNNTLYIPIIESCKTEKRKIEKLVSRYLLNLLQKKECKIHYNNNGKPYLDSSSQYISISHTQTCIAVAIANHPIGIDVEKIATKVLGLKKRFLSDTEIHAIDPNNELIHTLLLWSAKESVFKRIDATGIDFRKDIHIEKFTPTANGFFNTQVSYPQKQNSYTIFYTVFPQYVLTICF